MVSGGSQVSIYKDPGSSDLAALHKAGLQEGKVRYLGVASQKSVYVWDANAALHQHIMAKLASNKIIKNGLEYRNDEVTRGVALLKEGELIFFSDENWDLTYDKFKKGEEFKPGFIPSPWKTKQEIVDALPKMIKRFKFMDNYIKGFTENGPLKKLNDAILQAP